MIFCWLFVIKCALNTIQAMNNDCEFAFRVKYYTQGVEPTLKTLTYVGINPGDQKFFQFEIIMNVLAISFRFIWISNVMGCNHYKYVLLLQSGECSRVRLQLWACWTCRPLSTPLTMLQQIDFQIGMEYLGRLKFGFLLIWKIAPIRKN